MDIFKNGLGSDTFCEELWNGFYAESQEGFDSLASAINTRIDCHFHVQFKYLRPAELIGVCIEFQNDINRRFFTCLKNNNMRDNISRIEDILTAFASGLGYDY